MGLCAGYTTTGGGGLWAKGARDDNTTDLLEVAQLKGISGFLRIDLTS